MSDLQAFRPVPDSTEKHMSYSTVNLDTPMQSALQAHGESAIRILEITWVLFMGGALIFLGVMLVALAALLGPDTWRTALSRHSLVWGAGVVFPVVVLTALLVYTFDAAAWLVRSASQPVAARIEVTGEMWWWRVRHLDSEGRIRVETANEIHIPAGLTVELKLVSPNVIHSLWVPGLAGKMDLIPGKVNRLHLKAAAPGVFRGQCAEFCGAQHAKMALFVVAQTPDEHEAWLQARSLPASAPANAEAVRGQALFAEARCSVCHAVRGTQADGALGPDLTHVASRLSLAAGTLPNGTHSLMAWIADPQHIKPGSLMPGYRGYSDDELRALTSYLEGLR